LNPKSTKEKQKHVIRKTDKEIQDDGKMFPKYDADDRLYKDLEEFKTNTAPLLVVTTNWKLQSSRVSDFAVLEFKRLVIINLLLYLEATRRVRTQLLNINLPHTDPNITILAPENHVYIRDPRTYENHVISERLPSDYNMIYIDINENIKLNSLDTIKLADTIRSSLILTKNIILISSNKLLGNSLTKLLEVIYVPGLNINDSSEIQETLSWEPEDEVINCILLANAKNLFVFSEQSKPVTESYLAAKQLSNVLIQKFKFFYSRVEISPMPMYH
jgi:hypothetical protein